MAGWGGRAVFPPNRPEESSGTVMPSPPQPTPLHQRPVALPKMAENPTASELYFVFEKLHSTFPGPWNLQFNYRICLQERNIGGEFGRVPATWFRLTLRAKLLTKWQPLHRLLDWKETKSTQDTYRRKIKSKSRTSIRPRSLAWRLLEESSIRPRSLAWRLLEESWVRVEENQCTGGSPSRHRENEQTPFRQHQIRTCIAGTSLEQEVLKPDSN
ncbi:uncharacterized protein [Narcine bancroftii]|uniref:uncharacterized protein isoform X3 n=1 Tax=Narcine bancroftii TaxID=1343680 RepID=UPI00383174E0